MILPHLLEYCREKAAPAGSAVHYGLLLVPQAKRSGWLGVWALRRELNDVLQRIQDPRVAELKLAWWQTELEQAGSGAAAHPVSAAIGASVLSVWSTDNTNGLVQANIDLLGTARFFTDAEWLAYCRDFGGRVFELAAVTLTTLAVDTHSDALRQWGARSLQLTQLLLLAKGLRRGWHPVPVDILQRFAVPAEDLRARRTSPAFVKMMRELGAAIIADGEAQWRSLPPSMRLALRPLRCLWRIRCAEWRFQDVDACSLMTERLALTPLKKLWIAWSTQVLRR
ncbi:MAG: squalene/phytoene synthase family protein [Burkholderiaceae bacterium]|jgi:phytoene synthase